ncbi:YcjF family protein [Kangiella taiwanensis]|uniref:TIGR01620 family protein n=1 Tax=Kangiella taiwanensis TaxID=1079179 RepID=A0ABP8HRH8_9GAMM|nr:TIGR01620 family protein [Kangiella taiwanensis]
MSDKPVKFYSKDKAHQAAEKLVNEAVTSSRASDDGFQGQSLATTKASEIQLLSDRKKPWYKRLFWPSLSAFIITAAGYEAYQFVTGLLQENWLLGSGVGLLAGIVVISGGYSLFKGWKARRRFKHRQTQQQQFEQLLKGKSYGQANQLIASVTDEVEQYVRIEALKTSYEQKKQQVHNDQELIHIYSSSVLQGLDKMALDVVTKHASEAAAMVALSPLAAADMALVAWRSSKMIEQLSQLYGCPQTALGRFEMTKRVFKNMMLAGASELVADAGVELLGKSLTATISAKAAQGIGVGVLIARMGLQTMHLCRPIPFGQDDKPKLGQIRKSVYHKVVGLVKTASAGKADKSDDAIEKKK